MQHQKSYTLLYFLLLFSMLPCSKVKAQNVTSPYSILGIGDIDTKDYSRYFGTGNTSIARRDPYSYNFSNPASLTSLPWKIMNFDIAMRGRVSSFQVPGTDSSTSVSKDFAIKRLAMAFKVSATTGIAFGLRPYSSVNYQYVNTEAILSGNSNLIKAVDGSGGINQVYFSIGRQVNTHFSVGLTGSYLFGSLQRTTDYTSDAIAFSFTKVETNFLYGATLQGGLQYDSYKPLTKENSVAKKWDHHLGLTATVGTQLSGQLTTDYTDNSNPKDTIVPELVTNNNFKLPVSVGFGYSGTSNDKLTLSADVNYSKWPNQAVNYPNSYTTSTLRISAGLEYSYKKKIPNYPYPIEKYYLGFGASAENSYIMLNNNYLKDYSGTVGGGYNFSSIFSIYGGIESGIRGSISSGQIKETYTSFLIGFTLRDRWIGTKKFGKFY